jgi:hypothetical protein
VTCCAITADGAFLATGDSDGVFSVWAFRDSNPFVILAQRVRWAGDASARADDAILKCAFVDAEPPFEPESFGGFGGSGKNACEDRDGYRLVTAHYSRDADASRLLVWRVARKRSKLVARENGGKKNVTFATACEESGDDTDEDRTRTDDTDDATFVAEDRAFSDHAEIRGYELCVPAGGRTWRGRVADANVSDAGGAPKLVACGAAGWVTVMEVTDSGGRYSFETLYTSYDANVGARRARFLTLLSPRRDDGTKKKTRRNKTERSSSSPARTASSSRATPRTAKFWLGSRFRTARAAFGPLAASARGTSDARSWSRGPRTAKSRAGRCPETSSAGHKSATVESFTFVP